MSLQSIKERLRDVPGIQDLHMQILAGRQTYSFGGKIVALDAGASESQVIEAIRAAVASPAVAQMPAGTPVLQALPVDEAGGVSAISAPPAPIPSASAALLPIVNAGPATLQPSSPKATPMSVTGAGAAGHSLKALIEAQRAKIAADLETNMAKIQDGFTKQNAAVAAVGSLGDKVHAEADDLMASVGQFANDLSI